jgi:RNA polymerase sigma-70 factor (ECF subfamily)
MPNSQMSDEQLVEAFQAGQLAAYDELVSRWQGKIRGAVWRVLGSTEDAADITQEAFLRAFRGLKAFKREAKFSSWIYQIALNLCRDSLRRKKGKNYVSLDEPESQAPLLVSKSPSPFELTQGKEIADRVRLAIQKLTEDQREVIILKEYEGLTFAEIAETLGLPPSTVKTRLYRGLVEMKQHLARDGVTSASSLPDSTGS